MADKKIIKNSIGRKKIVCLGGGIGTVNLIKGLKDYTKNITVVVSMADEGGSSGRLRRLYKIFPPGDLVSCMAALSTREKETVSDLLTYRFPGDRYGKDEELAGHKLGNLIMAGLYETVGDINKAISSFKKIFGICGNFYPATKQQVSISAITVEGKEIYGEESIDLGKYDGQRILEKVILHPENVEASDEAIRSMRKADLIIAGPGDLYTTILPVLIVPGIMKALQESKAEKIFIVNVANKPFETKGYSILDYIKAIKDHLGFFPFEKVLTNTNYKIKIPEKYNYTYVDGQKLNSEKVKFNLVGRDLVKDDFPLYHCPKKLAKAVVEAL